MYCYDCLCEWYPDSISEDGDILNPDGTVQVPYSETY